MHLRPWKAYPQLNVMKLYLKIVITIFIFSTFACMTAYSAADDSDTTYVCHFTTCPILIDGYMNEFAWDAADSLEFYLPPGKNPVRSKTHGYMLWDEKYLYVFLKAEDKDIIATFTERDSLTFKEDVLEIFLKPTRDFGVPSYCNFEISPQGVVFDAVNRKGWRMNKRMAWNCPGLRRKTVVSGTLNEPKDEDEFWSLEVAIPWKSLEVMNAERPSSGDSWRFHLARYDYSKYLPEGKELQSTAVLSKVSFHYYQDWMGLVFVKNNLCRKEDSKLSGL